MYKTGSIVKIGVLTALAAVIAAPVAAQTALKASSALSTSREQTQSYINYFLNVLNAKGKGIIQTKYIGGVF